MSIGSVSFRATGGSSFDEIVRQPQSFVKAQAPTASTNIYSGQKKKKSKLIPILLGAGAAAAALALGSKSKIFTQGKLAEKIGSKQLGKKVLTGLDTAGSKIMEYGGKAVSWVKSKLPKAKEVVQEGTEQAAQVIVNG